MSLENLRDLRRKWVETNKANGFNDGIKRLLTDLYPDNAHFIYELLQNAEDTRASVVRFTLSDLAVEFEHNGERLFTLENVESITSIGVSTKRDDSTSIGKFGVGFKAVFAYTNTPEIHSGDFHFRIHDLVVPETDGVTHTKMGERETRFVFPFDNPKKPCKRAVEEVELGLRALGDNTLLFLSYIRKIEYLLPNGDRGTLERIEEEDGRIKIRTETSATQWLRFQKDVGIEDESGTPTTCRVAIAYQFNFDKKIHPLQAGQVSIYFPAEKETSNLRFHLHAPFASTVARDSVRDCEGNRKLRDHLADLVVESLVTIRDLDMLTVSFLAVLPNPQDNLSAFYEPIRDAIVQAFRADAFTPTRSGSHAPADRLYRGPARIQEVLDDDDLSLLTENEAALWAKNPPQENQREDLFLKSLKIDNWGWEELVDAMSMPRAYDPEYLTANGPYKKLIESFIAQKEDAWLLRFYALLGEACDGNYGECITGIRDLCIIRVACDSDNQHVTPLKAYFSQEDDTNAPPSDIFFVKPSVYAIGRSESQKKFARSFLERAGVRPYDAKAGIERILDQYRIHQAFSLKSHIEHIRQFISYWKKNPTDTTLFEPSSFLVDSVNDGEIERTCRSKTLYLDEPYEKTGLASLLAIHKKTAVWPGYLDEFGATGLKEFVDYLKAVGVMHELKVEKASTKNNGRAGYLRHDLSKPNIKWTDSAIDHDFSISEINAYLDKRSVFASRLIWHALQRADKTCAKACFRPNKQHPIREAESQLVYKLKKQAWIPDKESGEFRNPGDMAMEDLRTDFPYDDRNGLLTAIGFGENSRKRSEEYQTRNRDAQKIGFASAEVAEELARILKAGFLTLEDIRSAAAQHNQTEQPNQSVPDPDRRRKNVLANTADAPSKESVQKERSVQKGISEIAAQAKAYLRAKYKNPKGQLVCQCCKNEMPFKLPRSEEYYFEAVQCIGDKDTRHFQNRLALCPTCAAMYQYAREPDDTELRRRIVEHSGGDQADSVEIHVRLAGRDRTLRFVGTHWFDLKTVLRGA